ncbi:MAG TPA: hypothetical protein VGJ70_04155 [Solirubrobacteraceae bacterium]
MERPSLARLLAAATLTLAAAASPAAAAPRTWQEPTALGTVSSPGPGASAGALTSAGEAIAAWDEAGLQVAVAPRGGAPAISALDDRAGRPAVAVDAADGAFVAWRHDDGSGGGPLRVAYRPAGGGFGAAQDLGSASGDPALAAGAGGVAVLAWARPMPASGALEIVAAVRQPGGAWGTPETVAGPFAEVSDLHVGLDRAGGVLVAWREPSAIRAATRPAGGGAWTKQTVAQPSRATRGLDLAAGDAGAVLTWAEARGDQTGAVEVAVRQGAGSFGAPQELPSTALFDDAPRAAVDDAGNAAVVWPEGFVRDDGWAGVQGPIVGVTGRVGQGFGAVKIVSGAHTGQDPTVAVAPSGEALVAWQDWMGSVFAARTPIGGDPDTPVPVSCGPTKLQAPVALGVDGQGTGTLLAQVQGSGQLRLTQDAPAADSVAGPCGGRLLPMGSAVAGRPVKLDGLDFVPRLYNPPTLRSEWDFDNDGVYDETVDGYQAMHTFARPGRYLVTMKLDWAWPRPGMAGSEVHSSIVEVGGVATSAPLVDFAPPRRPRVARRTPATLGILAALRRGVPVRLREAQRRGTVLELVARRAELRQRSGRAARAVTIRLGRRAAPRKAGRVYVRISRGRAAVRRAKRLHLTVRARSGRRVLWRETVLLLAP